MPLSEFDQRKAKLESSHSKMTNYSSDFSTVMPDQDFVELLWENGQIVMQGQSSRSKKSTFNTLSPNSKFQSKDSGDACIPKIRHFGEMESTMNDFVPSAPFGLNAQADDASPWMDYHIDENLQNDYCSDFLSEFNGGHLSSQPMNGGTIPADRRNSFGNSQTGSRALAEAPEPRDRTGQLFQLPPQCYSSVPGMKPRPSQFVGGSSSTVKGSSVNLPEKASHKVDLGLSKPLPQPTSGVGVMNFSHFARPVARVTPSLQNVDRIRSHEKASTAASSNPVESSVINPSSGVKSQSVAQGQPPQIFTKIELRPPPELFTVGEPGPIHHGEASRKKYIDSVSEINPRVSESANCQSSNVMASVPLVRPEADKASEPAVASSSVCSVNSVGEDSNDPRCTMKRKTRESEEPGYHSEDLEDESVGIKKQFNPRTLNAKRSRAAEVHNLSERRRRDRINEKMRALQELIPNCNKVDKASMLDEAIEYLKTLQLQVQIMSMGNGICMPQMMLPPGMQHLHPPPMAHFSPMGLNLGMGMGLGYGMGGLDMNASPGCPMIPVPPMHGSHFPCHSMPVARPVVHGLPGMPASMGLQMYGIPGQGLPPSMPRPPAYSMPGLSPKANLMPQSSGATTTPISAVDTALASSSKDQEQQNI